MKLGEVIAVDPGANGPQIKLPQRERQKSARETLAVVTKPLVSIGMLATVIGVLVFSYDLTEVLTDLRELSLGTLAIIFIALLANVLAATVRFKTIANDIGHSVNFRQAMATVSTGTLAGAMFFQVAGQLIARGAMMGRVGVPFANVVVITAYERIISAIISFWLSRKLWKRKTKSKVA